MAMKLIRVSEENYNFLKSMLSERFATMNAVVSFLIESVNAKKHDTVVHDSISNAESNLQSVSDLTTASSSKERSIWRVWESYANAYRARYGDDAILNSKQLKHCKDLISRVGLELAIDVAAFYLTVNDRFQLQKCHALDYLVKDCESFVRRMKRDIRTLDYYKTFQAERAAAWNELKNKIQNEAAIAEEQEEIQKQL